MRTFKSTTILNYCKIGPDLIDFITDTTKEKIVNFPLVCIYQ